MFNVKSVMFFLFTFTALYLYTFTPIVNAEWNPTHPDPIIEYHYTYDSVGNITTIEDSVKNSTSTFTYDEVDRLTQAIGPYGTGGTQQTKTYSYDVVGNISGTPNLNTDGNGNITQLNGKTIEYDYENRPIKITETATGRITEFGYDYAGERTWKAVTSNGGTEETHYVGNIYEVHYSSSGFLTQTAHIYAGSMRVANRVTQNGMSRTYYCLGDHLGSTRMMTDALGNVVQDITYEPWGSTVTESSTTYHADYKYTGQALDDSTDLYYYGARYYDPSLKRFITPDTIVQSPYDPQTLNRYVYVRNNPLIYTNPTGHWRLDNFGVSVLQAVPYAMMFVPGMQPAAAIAIAMASSMAQAGLQGANFSEAMIAGGISGVTTGLGMGIGKGLGEFGGTLAGMMISGGVSGFIGGGMGAMASGASGSEAWRAAYQGAALGAGTAAVMWGVQQGIQEYRISKMAHEIAKRQAEAAARSLDISGYTQYAFAGDARMQTIMDGGGDSWSPPTASEEALQPVPIYQDPVFYAATGMTSIARGSLSLFAHGGKNWHLGLELVGKRNLIHIGNHVKWGVHIAIGYVGPKIAWLHLYLNRAWPWFYISPKTK